MFMWGFPALICALLASAVLLRRRLLMALAVTLAGLVATSLAPKTELPASALQVVVACAAGLEICYMAATRTRKVSVTGGAMASAGLPILILELPSGPGARPGRHRAAGRDDPGRGRAGRRGMARQPGATAG